MYKDKIAELFSDKEFAEKAFNMTPEELHEVLKERDIDVSIDEIKKTGDFLNGVISNGEELSEEALEAVAGGGSGFGAGLAVSLGLGGLGMAGVIGIAILTGVLSW